MNSSRRILAELSLGGEIRVDLGRAALLIAQEEYPDLEVRAYLERLDELAARAGAAIAGLAPEAASEALLKRLFVDEGFRGNEEDYYDPRNSYLNEVLDRKVGIPITLGVVALEVSRRLGVRIVGVGLPGHFVLRHPTSSGDRLFDPFRGGRPLSLDNCREIVSRASGGALSLQAEHLRAVTKREILLRILRNLKGCYLRAGDAPRALAAVERVLILDPQDHDELRERGTLLSKMGLATKALVDLESYLRLAPEAPDSDEVWEQIRKIREERSLLN